MAGDDYDLVEHRRDSDLGIFANNYGSRDLGALERAFVQPLVRNGTFDPSLNVWSEVTAGASS